MKTIRNENGEYEVLVGGSDQEIDISNAISEEAHPDVNAKLSLVSLWKARFHRCRDGRET